MAQDQFGTETVNDIITTELDTEDVRVPMGGSHVFRLEGVYRSAVDTVSLLFYIGCDESGVLVPVYTGRIIASRVGTLTVQ